MKSRASSAASITLPQPATAPDKSAHCDSEPSANIHNGTNSSTNTGVSPSHNADTDTDKSDVVRKSGFNSDLEPDPEPEAVEFDRLQFLRQFSACEDGYGRSGVALELASRTTESQPFEELKDMLLECVQQTAVSGDANVLTPFESQHWLCM